MSLDFTRKKGGTSEKKCSGMAWIFSRNFHKLKFSTIKLIGYSGIERQKSRDPIVNETFSSLTHNPKVEYANLLFE